jgi:hypothetical protein
VRAAGTRFVWHRYAIAGGRVTWATGGVRLRPALGLSTGARPGTLPFHCPVGRSLPSWRLSCRRSLSELACACLSAACSLLRGLCQALITSCNLQHNPPRVGRGQLVSLETRFSCALQPVLLVVRFGWHTSPCSAGSTTCVEGIRSKYLVLLYNGLSHATAKWAGRDQSGFLPTGRSAASFASSSKAAAMSNN